MQINTAALRAIREANGLSISALSRMTNGELSQPHISNIETGRRSASPKAVKVLASTLRIPRAAILCDPEALEVTS